MASVSSLDQDMRRLRLDRYTPQAASEAISWIETSLGERLPTRDLLAALKDGVVLCKLANLVLPSPGLRFKASSMPFTQRENIAHFLEACERPPLNLPAHDRFLTVDLYDEKDPAQVLQCLGAFSRAANRINPRAFPSTIGPKRADGGGAASLENAYSGGKGYTGTTADAGYGARSPPAPIRERTITPTATGGSSSSPPKPSPLGGGGVSSWSKKADEHSTAPAWNIHQYGYMGGASQGNQGIAFGARRQIIPPSVDVPSREEKERLRREREQAEQARADESERRRREEREAEEARAREEEQRRWQDETRKLREREAREAEEERVRREQYDRRRKQEEDARRQEEENERRRQEEAARTAEQDRIKDLERQLEEAKARERRYEHDRTAQQDPEPPAPSLPTRPTAAGSSISATDATSWDGDERDYLRKQWSKTQQHQAPIPPSSGMSTATSSRPLPFPRPGAAPPPSASRPLPQQPNTTMDTQPLQEPQAEPAPAPPPRAVATPPAVASAASTTPASSRGMSTPKKYGMSLLEREMERERARQREWEEAQMKKMKG